MKKRRIPDILEVPDKIKIETGTEEHIEYVGSSVVCFKDVEINMEKREDSVSFFLQASDTPVKRIWFTWKGSFSQNAKVLGDHWERGYGDLEWKEPEAQRILSWYFLVSEENMTVGYGVKVQPSAFCFWKLSLNEITLCLDVRCGGEGVILRGRRLEMAEAVMIQEDKLTAFETAEKLCSVMSPAPLKCPEIVYGGNNWYYAYGNSSEKDILLDTQYLAKMTEGIDNRPYMVIDDGWQSNYREGYNGGPWKGGNKKFPDMKGLAFKMKGYGVKPGIWIRLLLDEDESIPETWRLSRDKQVLDPSVPQVLEYVKENVRRLVEWGFHLIKHDFSTWDLFGLWGNQMGEKITEDGWCFRNTAKTSAEIVKNFYRAIMEASGEALILGCNCIGHLGAGMMHLNRTGDDTSGTQWSRTKKMGVNTLAFRMPQHKHFFEVDADCVGITEKIPWGKNRQWLKVLSESGTPRLCP